MNVASFGFLLLVLVGSAFFFALPRGAARRAILTILNGVFLWTLVPDLITAGVLGAFLLSGYAAARVAMRWPSRWIQTGTRLPFRLGLPRLPVQSLLDGTN